MNMKAGKQADVDMSNTDSRHEATKQIEALCDKARAKLKEAEEIANKHGIQFMFMHDMYVPKKPTHIPADVKGQWGKGNAGWQASSCY